VPLNLREKKVKRRATNMLKTETRVIAEDYDFESVRALTVTCECGAIVPDEPLFTEGLHRCQCGKTAKLAELDKLADSLE
jgi:hypothetical protein